MAVDACPSCKRIISTGNTQGRCPHCGAVAPTQLAKQPGLPTTLAQERRLREDLETEKRLRGARGRLAKQQREEEERRRHREDDDDALILAGTAVGAMIGSLFSDEDSAPSDSLFDALDTDDDFSGGGGDSGGGGASGDW